MKRAEAGLPRHARYDRRTAGARRGRAREGVAEPLAGPEAPPIVVRGGGLASQEVALGELGACLAAAIADVQRELARYPNPLGAYVLDELEVALPVATRVDDLGQAMVTLVNPEPGQPAPAIVRFRLRPVLGAPPPPPPAASQPVSSIGTLTPAMVAALNARRIFSVDDLGRVLSTPAGMAGVERLGVPVKRVLGRAQLFDIPGLPAPVSVELAKSYASPLSFARASPESLAARLSRTLHQKVDADVVRQWQAEARSRIEVPLPVIRKPVERSVRA